MTDLEKALILIRDICKEHKYCRDCPLYVSSDGNCGIRSQPEKWRLKNDGDPNPDKVFWQ